MSAPTLPMGQTTAQHDMKQAAGHGPASGRSPAQGSSPAGEQLLDQVVQQTSERLEKRASAYAKALGDSNVSRLQRAMLMSQAVEDLSRLIDETKLMPRIMPLMNKRVGFRTDRAPGNKNNSTPYSVADVKGVLIEALLAGVFPVGNEFNIIAGGLYITREGYERMIREIPGLSELDVIGGVPAVHNGRMVVRMGVRWRLHGVPNELRDHEGKPGRPYAIISHESTTPDAVVGKGARKALKSVYSLLTGSSEPEDQGDELPPVDVAQEPGPEDPSVTPEEQIKAQDLYDEIGNKIAAALDVQRLQGLAQDVQATHDLSADAKARLLDRIDARAKQLSGAKTAKR